MFTTAEDIYQSFLDGIRRTKQSVVKRDKFIRIWNEWSLNEWVNRNLSFQEGFELTQKQIDDLETLIIVTDGSFDIDGNTDDDLMYPLYSTNGLFKLPKKSLSVPYIDVDTNTTGTMIYSPYKRSISIWFMLRDTTTWVKSTPLKAIDVDFITQSNYSSPAADMIYHKIRNGHVEFVGGTAEAEAMKLEYVKYPNEMSLLSGSLAYTIDLGQDQLEEVRDIAVGLYLERVTDKRWQSFLQEDMLKRESQK